MHLECAKCAHTDCSNHSWDLFLKICLSLHQNAHCLFSRSQNNRKILIWNAKGDRNKQRLITLFWRGFSKYFLKCSFTSKPLDKPLDFTQSFTVCFNFVAQVFKKIHFHTCQAKLPYLSKKCIFIHVVCLFVMPSFFHFQLFSNMYCEVSWVLEKCYWNKQIRYLWWRKLITWIWFHCIEQTWRHCQTSSDSSFSVRHNGVVLIDLLSQLSLISPRQSIQDYKSHIFTVKMDSIMTTQQKMRRNLFITDRQRKTVWIQVLDSENNTRERLWNQD